MHAGRSMLLALAVALPLGEAQTQNPRWSGSANYWVVPQCRAFAIQKRQKPVAIQAVRADVQILERTARTTLRVFLHNPSSRQEEAVLLLPVPRGAAVSEFSFAGKGLENSARLLSREEARRTYRQIVQKLRDPALLEFAGHSLIRSSVFPVPAGGKQTVQIVYEHVLAGAGGRVDYVLPRSASLEARVHWEISARVSSKSPISMVYSPSHALRTKRRNDRQVAVTLAPEASKEPGAFRLSYLLAESGRITASLFSYPDPSIGGGYFLLMAGLPPFDAKQLARVKREVTVVLDVSGSMAGEKMDQARAAALQVIEGLGDGESFNIVDYSNSVHRFAARAVPKNRENTLAARKYLAALRPGGGTNIGDALIEALRPEPQQGSLPIVLFLTDGLPTIGRTSESYLRELASQGNPHERRVFTFGVGNDVNAPLLDALAERSRGTATYVQPSQDVELAVSSVFRRLYGPVLSRPELVTLDGSGRTSTRRVRDLQPNQLPDLFEDDQLVLLGKYVGEEPLRFQLTGELFGEKRSFHFRFGLDRATTQNAFVPRLWATRQIATLVDEVRRAGARLGSAPVAAGYDPFQDPRLQELRNEILRLSTEFGVLSEYTSFLATEGSRGLAWSSALLACGNELHTKAMRTRSGMGAVNQSMNGWNQKQQKFLNPRNVFFNDKLERVAIDTVRQLGDRAYFRRGNSWVEGHLLKEDKLEAKRTIELGSEAYQQLLETLLQDGREATLSLKGEIVLKLDGEIVRIVNH